MSDLREKDTVSTGVDAVTELTRSLSFDEKVIKKIIGLSSGEVPGILAISGNLIAGITDKLRNTDDPTRGITVEVGKNQVSVNMKIICEYGRNLPAIFQDMTDKATANLKEMTGLNIIEFKVHVHDILTKEDFERQSRRKADEKVEEKPVEPLALTDNLEE